VAPDPLIEQRPTMYSYSRPPTRGPSAHPHYQSLTRPVSTCSNIQRIHSAQAQRPKSCVSASVLDSLLCRGAPRGTLASAGSVRTNPMMRRNPVRGVPDPLGCHLREVQADHIERDLAAQKRQEVMVARRSAKHRPGTSPQKLSPPRAIVASPTSMKRVVPLLMLPSMQTVGVPQPSHKPWDLSGLANTHAPSHYATNPEDNPYFKRRIRLGELAAASRMPPKATQGNSSQDSFKDAKKTRFHIPSMEESAEALRGIQLQPGSFGNLPTYWDRYHVYKAVVKKFRMSPSYSSCLQ